MRWWVTVIFFVGLLFYVERVVRLGPDGVPEWLGLALGLTFYVMVALWAWHIFVLIVRGVVNFFTEASEKRKAEEERVRQWGAAMLKRQEEAEDYIIRSGDVEAIKTLMLARSTSATPANYMQTLSAGMNKGNDTLKVALGVMTGAVAGNLVSTAVTTAAVQNALVEMQAEFGGIEFYPDIGGDDSDGDGGFWDDLFS